MKKIMLAGILGLAVLLCSCSNSKEIDKDYPSKISKS